MTASLLVVLKWTVAFLILAIGTDSSLSDLTYLWRRPALLVRSLLAMCVVVPLIAVVIVRSFALPTGVNLALLVLAVSAGASLLPRRPMRLGNRAYLFSLVVSSSLLSIVTVPAWVGILAPMFGKTSTLTATLVVVYLIASAVVSLPYLRWRARSSVAPTTV